jgi:integrase
VRAAFGFGYRDHPHKFNPAAGLRTLRINKKDRPPVDPFSIQQAEEIIAASHRMFGRVHGNYEEFRFFTGLRQSEQFALLLTDYDPVDGTIMIDKACVLGRDKNRTKTNQDRVISLCPRALQVLKRHLALREELAVAGEIRHAFIFFWDIDLAPIRDVSQPYKRWRQVMETLPTIRYRPPYNCRHSYISWRLMVGHNRLLVAQDDGHSVSTMERTYAAWVKGNKPEDGELIERALSGDKLPSNP